MNKEFYFTSESVTEGHPDKVCDCISDAILDGIFEKDKNARVACETMASSNKIIISGEITTSENLKSSFYSDIARDVLNEIGYSNNKVGMDGSNVDIEVHVVEQSSDIARGLNRKTKIDQGAGDQGLMFGFACRETKQLMPLPIYLAHQLAEKLTRVRKSKELDFLRPDGKTQVTIKYDGFKPVEISKVVIATQHDDLLKKFSGKIKKEQDFIRDSLIQNVVDPIISGYDIPFSGNVIVNGTGRFVKGGPGADTGLTGRKIIVDTYGGAAPHGGGAFSGKDPTKVDRSAAYAARYLAKNVVASKIADKCLIQLAYAIGVSKPLSIYVDLFANDEEKNKYVEKLINENFDLSPRGIREMLGLNKPIYQKSAAYGHFGRDPESDGSFSWEKTDKSEIFNK